MPRCGASPRPGGPPGAVRVQEGKNPRGSTTPSTPHYPRHVCILARPQISDKTCISPLTPHILCAMLSPMSQRLLISPSIGFTGCTFYDAIIWPELTDTQIKLILRRRWFCMTPRLPGFYLGPWRINIRDRALFDRVSPMLWELFAGINEEYPDCIWTISLGDNDFVEHPRIRELNDFLAKGAK